MWRRENSDIPKCPRTGKPLKSRAKNNWARWLFPITGLAATIWFLIRVIPKPSRATYPCQRLVFPFASSFIAYILGIFGTGVALRKARRRLHQSRYVLAGICIFVGLISAWLTISIDSRQVTAGPFVPIDPPNSPFGEAKGLFPGRVSWAHDANATYWDPAWNESTEIFYWDDDHTDANVVEAIMSDALQWLAGEVTDEASWHALFKHFNQTKGKGSVGYMPGEKIAIKPNHVEQRWHYDEDNTSDASPQVLVALLKQLVWEAGVPENCITVCDSSRYIADKTFYRCHALFPDVTYADTNYYVTGPNDINIDPNRPSVQPTPEPKIYYSGPDPDPVYDYIPMPFYEADYVINLAIMRGHAGPGITLTGKNWYGCFCNKPRGKHHGYLVEETYGRYKIIVELMGHEHLGAKTMLFILDGLWGFPRHGNSPLSRPKKWQNTPFNDDYPSSILMSQDHVAIDSVGLDFLRAEFGDNMGTTGIDGAIDDYLHEAALANDPCSGTFYDPHRPIGDPEATRLENVGVHEHWNDPNNKQYSRNLDTGDGIELVWSPTVECTAALDGDVDGDCRVNHLDLKQMADEWLLSGNVDSNLDGIGNVNLKDFAILANDWNKNNLSP